MNDHRQTGRTTRMIEHARKLAIEDRRAVYITAANRQDQKRIQSLVGQPDHGIKVETSESMSTFDWQGMTLDGAWPNCVVLIDHYAIESRFGPMLRMLHAYDLGADAPTL